VGRSRRCVDGDRKRSAVCNCHEFRTLSPFGCTHTESPFFAGVKLPSMKHSERFSPPRSSRSRASAFKAFLNRPVFTQWVNRLWHVWYGGNFLGRSCHGAPVLSTQITAFIMRLLEWTNGLPLGIARLSSIKGATSFHWAAVNISLPPSAVYDTTG
jgi:hypothetical protein